MKTIFLDIDGVLNIISDMYTTQFDSKYIAEPYQIAVLNYIMATNQNIDIVITSTRRENMTKLKLELEQAGFIYNSRIVGATQLESKPRGRQIKEYIQDNNISQYIVLDDNIHDIHGIDIKEIPKSNLLHVDAGVGLTHKDIWEISKILKGPK